MKKSPRERIRTEGIFLSGEQPVPLAHHSCSMSRAFIDSSSGCAASGSQKKAQQALINAHGLVLELARHIHSDL